MQNRFRNVGRYAHVPHEQRDAFESRLSHNGYSDFSIAQIDSTGRFAPRAEHTHYFPVSVAGPSNTVAPALLGFDLGNQPDLADKLAKNATTGEHTIVMVPSEWPIKADIMILRSAVAMNNRQPNAPVDTHTGGYWLALDVPRLFSGLASVTDQFDVTVELVEADSKQRIFFKPRKQNERLYFTGLFNPSQTENAWMISSSTKMVITLEQSMGLSQTTLLVAGVLIVLVITASLFLTSHLVAQRTSELEHHEGFKRLSFEREKAEKTLNSVQDAIITLSTDLTIVHINPAAVLQFNTRASAVIGKSLDSLSQFHRANKNRSLLDVRSELASLTHNVKKDIDVIPAGHLDDDFILRMSISSSTDYAGSPTGHILVLRDISHEHRLSRKLAYQANYDSLTGCTNRHYFDQSLERLLAEMPKTKQTHTLCYMDLDQFKVVNDTCGHRAGDQLLIELTKNMKLFIREEDILSRLGGDEFGLILVDVDRHEATMISNRVFEFFQNFHFSHQGNTFSVTASIGIVHIDSSCATSKDIMASADIACYAAKDSGRNSMSVYSKSDESMTERSEEMNWLPRLQTALQNNEFRLHVQAVASLAPEHPDLPITHFEFLLRLANKDGTEVTPWQFIQAAERYDLMREIDRWVIKNALSTVAEYRDGPGSNCSYSINLSGQSAADPTLKAFILEQIYEHNIDPSKIWFELTETAAISHFSVAVDLIKSIRSAGAKVALDDFGSGLSSFGYLKNLPVDIIKIDGQFVKEIARNSIDREMVQAIHRVGESMNIETVAEFVENQEIVDVLKKIGVNYAQGYHIGKPVPVAQAIAALDPPRKAA